MSDKRPAGAESRVSPTAPESRSLSAMTWRIAESTPGFTEQLRAAEAELASGGGVLYDVRDGALRKVRHPRR